VWSRLDRQREHYVSAQKWFRVFMRLSVATTMLEYGSVKAVPLQMPAPTLNRLLEPFGYMSPMGVLWASIGASRGYEMFAGVAELTAAILLFIPGITTLGAMVCFAVVTQVFMLNMTYDVPVKLFSFHLLVMCVVLLAPDARRLLNVLILNRSAAPFNEVPLAKNRRRQRILIAAQLVFAVYAIGLAGYGAASRWISRGGGAPTPPLYGIWNVEQMRIDGVTRSALVTDYDRWRRVTFPFLGRMSFQRMDANFVTFSMKLDTTARTIELSKPDDQAWQAKYKYEQPEHDRLILDGTMDKHAIHMDLKLEDHTKYLLLSRGFHWIQESPFNR
jgi:hypothetical protein